MIRSIRRSDLAEVVELCRLHAAHEGAPYCENGQVTRLEAALCSPAPLLHAWVTERTSGGLDGYMTATIDFATWPARPLVYMDCLFLREGVRGGGLGRAFMKVLAAFATRHGSPEIQWQTPPGNSLGIGFYQRIGASSLPKLRFTISPESLMGNTG